MKNKILTILIFLFYFSASAQVDCSNRNLGDIVVDEDYKVCNIYTAQTTVNFVFPSDNLNALEAGNEYYINFDDGMGDVLLDDLPLPLNEISRTYSTAGTKNVKILMLDQSPLGDIFVLKHSFFFTINIFTGTYFSPDEIITVETNKTYDPPLDCISYNIDEDPFAAAFLDNVVGEAKASVRFGIGHTEFVKPIIFIDGLDFGTEIITDPNFSAPDNVIRYGTSGWDALITGTTEEFFEAMDQSNFHLYPEFLEELYLEGFDFVFLDFQRGTDYIQKNALLLEELLTIINNRKIQDSNTGTLHGNVVLGASSGGQVARYALAKMESDGIDHCTETYISLDAPQQGANIPLSLQSAAWYDAVSNFSSNAKEHWHLLNHPAPRQLLAAQFGEAYQEGRLTTEAWANNSTQYPSRTDVDFGCLRSNYLAELEALEYPRRTKNIGISCGSINNINQGYENGDLLYSANLKLTYSLFNRTIFTVRMQALDGADMDIEVSRGKVACSAAKSTYSQGPNAIYGYAEPLQLQSCWGSDTNIPRRHKSVGVHTDGSFPGYDNAPGSYSRNLFFFDQEIRKRFNALPSGNTDQFFSFPESRKQQCFIPTMSALDIQLEMNNDNMFMDLSTLDILDLSPFDSFYAPVDENLKHMEINEAMKNWVMNELTNNPSTFISELPTSPSETTFNIGVGENRISDIEINDGGVLRINNSGPTGFLNGTDSPNKVLNLNLGGCEDGNVLVRNGGRFILGDDLTDAERRAIVRISGGTKVEVESGGLLRIAKGSQLIVEDGAQLIIHEGARVDLWWNDFWFDGQTIEGSNILVKSGGELVVHGDFDFTGSGFFQFDEGNTLTLTNDWQLEGNGKGKRFMRLNKNAILKMSTVKVELRRGKVEYARNSLISAESEATVWLTHMEMEGIAKSSEPAKAALAASKANKIRVFNTMIHGFEYGLRLFFMEEDGKECTIQISEFDNNLVGVYANGLSELEVVGTSFSPGDMGTTGLQLADAPNVVISSSNIESFLEGIYIPASGLISDDDNDGIIDNVNNTNLVLKRGTTLDGNVKGIRMIKGGQLSSGQLFGKITLDCAKLINNYRGITGTNVFLDMDACALGGQPASCDPGLVNSNTFINAYSCLMFNIQYEDDPNDLNYLPQIIPNCGIAARGNYWQSATGVIGPLPDNEYSFFVNSVSCNQIHLDMDSYVIDLPSGCSNAPNDGGGAEPGDGTPNNHGGERSSAVDNENGWEKNQGERILVFPNPTNDYFTVRYGAYEAKVVVRTVLGKEMFSGKSFQELQVEVDGWDAGIYMIEVINQEYSERFTRRVVIQK